MARPTAPPASGPSTGEVLVFGLALAALLAAARGRSSRWDPSVARNRAAPTVSQPPPVPPPHEETPLEKARRLRAAAFVNLKKGYDGDAEDQLDEAKALDPDGEDDPAVQQARGDIKARKYQLDPGLGFSKGGLGPGERPLKRTPPKRP